jgi:transcriptional regulator with XRE-family HTH domain
VNSLLEQIKKRRNKLGLKQKDMMLRVGMSPQQYQRLEAKGNPRLNTLELVAKGLKGELMLIPQDKVAAVKVLLSDDDGGIDAKNEKDKPTIADNPWKNILKDDE